MKKKYEEGDWIGGDGSQIEVEIYEHQRFAFILDL